MKKTKILFITIFILIFASCSNDDNESGITNDITGKWYPKHRVLYEEKTPENKKQTPYPHRQQCGKDYLTLESNKTWKRVKNTADCSLKVIQGKYNISGKELTVSGDKNISYQYSLNGNSLELKSKMDLNFDGIKESISIEVYER